MMPILQTDTYKTLRVGISGHRYLSDLQQLTKALEDVYQTLNSRFPKTHWQICSPLAEGADRLAASVFLQRHAELVVILPLPIEEYSSSFSTQESREEFFQYLHKAQQIIHMPLQPDHKQAFSSLGLFLVDYCDILIMIWDGLNSQGDGGTGNVVEEARRREKPLVWIHAGNRIPGTHIATSLGSMQGKIDFENIS